MSWPLRHVWASASFQSRHLCHLQDPHRVQPIFHRYMNENDGTWDKPQTVQAIAEQTNKQVLDMMADDLNKYETEALETFKQDMWVKMGTKSKDLEKHLRFSAWQYLVAGGLGAGAILGGIAAGDAAFVAGYTALYGAGAATAVGMTVFVPVGLAFVAWVCKDKLGIWSWEGAEKASWAVVLDACQKNFPKIGENVKNGFSKKVDGIVARIEEHREAPANSEDSGSGVARIQHSATKGYKDVAKRLQKILLAREDRWLGKKQSILEKICKEVLQERQPKKPQLQEPLHMGAMSSDGRWVLSDSEGSPVIASVEVVGALPTECKDWTNWSAAWLQKRVVVWFRVWSDSCMKSMRCRSCGGSQTIFCKCSHFAPLARNEHHVMLTWSSTGCCWMSFGAWRFHLELGGSFLFQEKGGIPWHPNVKVFLVIVCSWICSPPHFWGPKTSEKSLKVSFGAISTFVFVVECLQWQTCNTMYLLDLS